MSQTGAGLDDIDVGDSVAECRVATNAALSVILEECSESALKQTIGKMVGVSDDVDAVVADAPDSLEQADCLDLRSVRGWVITRVFELINQQGEDAADALSTAWSEANDACGWG